MCGNVQQGASPLTQLTCGVNWDSGILHILYCWLKGKLFRGKCSLIQAPHSPHNPRCPRIYHLIVSAHHWNVSTLHARSDSIIIFFYSITTSAQWAALWTGIRAIYVIDIIRYWFHTTFNVLLSAQLRRMIYATLPLLWSFNLHNFCIVWSCARELEKFLLKAESATGF